MFIYIYIKVGRKIPPKNIFKKIKIKIKSWDQVLVMDFG
jgi:hypothetical protein